MRLRPTRKHIKIFVALAFLGYGLIRLGVGSVLLGQEMGIFSFQPLHEALTDIGNFIEKASDRQIFPVSVRGYVGYIALMGLVLSAGALGTLKDRTIGPLLIAAFIAMYTLLFVNFQTVNPKVVHLAVCVLLFGVLLWSKGVRPQPTRSSA